MSSLLGSNSQIRGPEYNRIQITFISPWPQTWVIKRLEMAWKCDKRETKVNLSLSGTKMWMKILRKMYKWDGKMLGIGIKQAIDGNVKLLLSFLEIFSETCGQRSQHSHFRQFWAFGVNWISWFRPLCFFGQWTNHAEMKLLFLKIIMVCFN